MRYSASELRLVGLRPHPDAVPLDRERFRPSYSNYDLTRDWWGLAQTVSVVHRKPELAVHTERTTALVETARSLGLEVFASSTAVSSGAVRFEVFDTIERRYVAGHDDPDGLDSFTLTLDQVEELIAKALSQNKRLGRKTPACGNNAMNECGKVDANRVS
jgi:hypothetical protein